MNGLIWHRPEHQRPEVKKGARVRVWCAYRQSDGFYFQRLWCSRRKEPGPWMPEYDWFDPNDGHGFCEPVFWCYEADILATLPALTEVA